MQDKISLFGIKKFSKIAKIKMPRQIVDDFGTYKRHKNSWRHMSVLNVERKHWTSIRNMHTSIADKFQ
jgi:hypothetical protein